jgi:hypothetical protein
MAIHRHPGFHRRQTQSAIAVKLDAARLRTHRDALALANLAKAVQLLSVPEREAIAASVHRLLDRLSAEAREGEPWPS